MTQGSSSRATGVASTQLVFVVPSSRFNRVIRSISPVGSCGLLVILFNDLASGDGNDPGWTSHRFQHDWVDSRIVGFPCYSSFMAFTISRFEEHIKSTRCRKRYFSTIAQIVVFPKVPFLSLSSIL